MTSSWCIVLVLLLLIVKIFYIFSSFFIVDLEQFFYVEFLWVFSRDRTFFYFAVIKYRLLFSTEFHYQLIHSAVIIW